MPVQLGTIRGKVDLTIERALTDLAAAVNQLEAQQRALQPSEPHAIVDGLRRVTARVDDLTRRVQALGG